MSARNPPLTCLFKSFILLVLAALSLGQLASAQEISEAEQMLFVTDHLSKVHPPAQLRYRYTMAGPQVATIEDRAWVSVAQSDGGAKRAHVEFLSDQRHLPIPDIEPARGNPILLAFLEREVRELQRRTGGQAAYFRKRLRMALAGNAQIGETVIQFDGKPHPGLAISVQPFQNDDRLKQFAGLSSKRYEFILSDKILGGVFQIRSSEEDGSTGVSEEMLTFEGVTQ